MVYKPTNITGGVPTDRDGGSYTSASIPIQGTMRFDGGAIGMTCETELMAAVEASLGAAPAGTQESQEVWFSGSPLI